MSFLRSILTVSLLTYCLIASAAPVDVCNGAAALCDRKYSQVSFIGTHNSPFVGDLPTQNQAMSVTEQLNAGIRYLQGQTHNNPNGELHMCHTDCLLEDAGSLQNYLSTVKSWVEKNPNEVITLLLTNGDSNEGVKVDTFDNAFKASGLIDYAFKPSGDLTLDTWPTLRELIESNQRLIVFLDYGADMNRFPYILDEFKYYFETPFDTTDPDFKQCKIDRPAGASPDGRLYLVNHYLDFELFGIFMPNRVFARRTNAAKGKGSIGAQNDLCKGLYGRLPHVVLVDYFNEGDVFTAQRDMNGL